MLSISLSSMKSNRSIDRILLGSAISVLGQQKKLYFEVIELYTTYVYKALHLSVLVWDFCLSD